MMRGGGGSEQDLVRDVQRGDRSAMKLLYCRYAGRLTAVCTRYLGGSDEAKDVLQDCFMKIFASIGSFKWRGDGSLQAWMTRIVVNESLDFLRRSKQLGTVCYGELPDMPEEEEEPDVDGLSPEAIQKLVCRLPAGYRAVFNLYVLEQKSHKEIAALLGISASTSASQLHRAKAVLAKEIRIFKSHDNGR